MIDRLYHYRAVINPQSKWPNGIYDGDTLDLLIDCGFDQQATKKVRVLGVNTPELRGYTRDEGIVARQKTVNWVAKASIGQGRYPLLIRTENADSFGRYLADIYNQDGESLSAYLRELGYPDYRR